MAIAVFPVPGLPARRIARPPIYTIQRMNFQMSLKKKRQTQKGFPPFPRGSFGK
jgi:hypothetical protein